METDTKSVENKEKSSTKKSKESLGILSMNTGKHDENDKGSGTSANALSQRLTACVSCDLCGPKNLI